MNKTFKLVIVGGGSTYIGVWGEGANGSVSIQIE